MWVIGIVRVYSSAGIPACVDTEGDVCANSADTGGGACSAGIPACVDTEGDVCANSAGILARCLASSLLLARRRRVFSDALPPTEPSLYPLVSDSSRSIAAGCP